MRKERHNNYRVSRYSNDTKKTTSNTSRGKKTKLRLKKSVKKFFSTFAFTVSILIIAGSIGINYLTKDVSNLNKAMLEGRYSHSEIVKISDVPENMKNAIIAIEDSRFYSHKGIDLIGLTRAFVKNCIYKTSEGASTIEMQISKNLVTSSEQTFERKLKDMRVAYEMNKTMSKDDILQIYLNSIYLNRGATGIKAGARIFFAKDVSELNLAECAMLAGITKNPSKYTPYTIEEITLNDTAKSLDKNLLFTEIDNEDNKESKMDEEIINHLIELGCINEEQKQSIIDGELIVQKAVLNQDSIDRQRVVLKRMRDLDFISKKEYEQALSTKIVIDTSLK